MKARSVREALYACVDVETTGLDPRGERVVEVACRVTRGKRKLTTFDSLVNRGRAIPASASAPHRTTDADAADAPRLEAVVSTLRAMCADAAVVAHNARFDLVFSPFLADRPLLCSMRFARLVGHDASSFSNHVLRYHLGVSATALAGANAHRARGDVIVTSELFAACLERYLAAGERGENAALISTIAGPRTFGGPSPLSTAGPAGEA